MDNQPPLPDDLATLWYLVRRVGGLMDRDGEALFQRELGISLAQFLVLSVVDAHPGPLNQQQVADRLGLTKGTVSRQIDHAVSAGLMTVRPSPHSRRENAVLLTPEGTDLVRRGDTALERGRAEILSLIDPDDLGAALRVLAAMNDALGTHRGARLRTRPGRTDIVGPGGPAPTPSRPVPSPERRSP